MRLLFDQNLSFKLCARLEDLYPDSNQVRMLGLDKAGDRHIWEYAGTNGFTFVTQDSDYAELSALFGAPAKIVWLRCGDQPTSVVEQLIRYHAEAVSAIEGDDSVSCLEIR